MIFTYCHINTSVTLSVHLLKIIPLCQLDSEIFCRHRRHMTCVKHGLYIRWFVNKIDRTSHMRHVLLTHESLQWQVAQILVIAFVTYIAPITGSTPSNKIEAPKRNFCLSAASLLYRAVMKLPAVCYVVPKEGKAMVGLGYTRGSLTVDRFHV